MNLDSSLTTPTQLDAAAASARAAELARLSTAEVDAALADLRPRLRADGGDCQLVGIDGNKVMVRLSGACVGCQLSQVTVAGLQQRLIERLGRPLRIIPVGR